MSEPSGRPAADARPGATEEVLLEIAAAEEFVVVEQVEQIEGRRPGVHHVVSWLLLDRVRSMAMLLAMAVFALTFIVQPFRIPSESMEHTLLVGDFLLVNKAIFAPAGHWGWLMPYRTARRGDVVVFHFPLNAEEHVVKRVIGAPGDRIQLRNGVVYRNGVALAEPYTAQGPSSDGLRGSDAFRDDFPDAPFTDPGTDTRWWTEVQRSLVNGELVVPVGDYFVMGDNRDHSRDSRYWGFVSRRGLVGMPLLIYYSAREASRTDKADGPDDRLGRSGGNSWLDFARWDRFLKVVR